MPKELRKLSLTLEEILKPKQLMEVELLETPDLGDETMNEEMSSVQAFNLGLENAQATTLSNLIAKKLKGNSISTFTTLSDILTNMYAFILKLIQLIQR